MDGQLKIDRIVQLKFKMIHYRFVYFQSTLFISNERFESTMGIAESRFVSNDLSYERLNCLSIHVLFSTNYRKFLALSLSQQLTMLCL